jgi:ABC-type dipeptide/oligopeptide/nickel transport system permease subunit
MSTDVTASGRHATSRPEHVSSGRLAIFMRRLRRNRAGLAGGIIVLLVFAAAICAPVVAPYPPNALDFAAYLGAPTLIHPFGTDEQGRDVLSRVIFGGQVSLRIGFIAVSIAMAAGVALGLIAGYYEGCTGTFIMRWMDVMLAFPSILLALAIVAVLGSGITPLMVAVGIASIPQFTRVAQASVLSTKEADYVQAAWVVGCSPAQILVRHILPNIFAPITVLATTGVAAAIITGAALSFLGLGAQPPTPEWGSMLSNGRVYMEKAPWMMVFPGLAIMVTVMSINLFGDGLRDALDPRLK